MRVMRYQTNPANQGSRVPDYAALEGGVMRMLVAGEAYEIATGHPAASTVAKAICKGELSAIDDDSAKEAARVFGAPNAPLSVPLRPTAPVVAAKPSEPAKAPSAAADAKPKPATKSPDQGA